VGEDPTNPQIRLKRADVLLRLKRVEDATKDLEFALVKMPDDARPPNVLGNIAFAQKRFAVAEDWFRDALERDPNHYFALFHLGMLQIAGRRHEEAASTFRHVLRLKRAGDAPQARAKNNLGCALIKGKIDLAEGIRLIEEAVREEPEAADLRLSLADALINLERPKEAIPHLVKAREIAGDLPRIAKLMERAKGE
jgi:tetratricopeptide (TPR) repeat protein